MRVGMPHFGNVHVPVKAIAGRLAESGGELVVPPPTSQRTLELGVKYSPAEACLPYKLTLGNLIEACELGAEVLLQGRGIGICRLGYYARQQEQVLRELGYDVRFCTVDVSRRRVRSVVGVMRKLTGGAPWPRIVSALLFGMVKLFAVDRIEHLARRSRAVELEKGSTNRVYREAVAAIDEATGTREVRRLAAEYAQQLGGLPRQPEADPLKVALVGEIFVVLDPFANMDIETELGRLGVEVERSMSLSRWVKYSLVLNKLGVDQWKDVHEAAMPYLRRSVGGDGWESVGEKVVRAREGFDGLIHLAPFTCMPEIVAQNVMPSTREDIPVLTVLCDEQMAKQGMVTRLEAFADLLRFRRKRRRG